jgi:hypothetical protein
MKTKLLSIGADAKTRKAWEEFGHMTAVMYLAPWRASGAQFCRKAKIAGCDQLCLGLTSGHFNIGLDYIAPYGVPMKDNACQRAKLARSRLLIESPGVFHEKLDHEIHLFVKRAARANLTPAIRLNGTSDLDFSAVHERWPDVIFYDYTKHARRAYENQADNYSLALSYSGASEVFARGMWEAHQATGLNLVLVMRNEEVKQEAMRQAVSHGHQAVDGDLHDFRFLDPARSLVFLRAKGAEVIRSRNGFVLDSLPRYFT